MNIADREDFAVMGREYRYNGISSHGGGEDMITIITGESGVGKTTFLLKKIQQIKNSGRTVHGIITPPLYNEQHEKIGFSALNTDTGEEWELARTDKILSGPSYGPFHFSEKGFAKANSELSRNLKSKKRILFLDEIGPLELKHKEGYYPVFNLLETISPAQNIILVIRPSLIEEFINRYIPRHKYRIIAITARNRDSVMLDVPAK